MTTATDRTRVLVIDDEAAIRLLCRVNLEAEGMEVLEAADGRAGLELARAESPDVILLDMNMPVLDGLTVAEELIADEREPPPLLVFLTGSVELGEHARALELDAVEYVTKPFDPVLLAPLLRGLLDGGRKRAQADSIERLRRLLENL